MFVPFLEFAEHETLTVLDGVLTIEATLHLAKPCDSLVVEAEQGETARKRIGRLDVVAEIDGGERLQEFEHIVGSRIVFFDLLVAKVIR